MYIFFRFLPILRGPGFILVGRHLFLWTGANVWSCLIGGKRPHFLMHFEKSFFCGCNSVLFAPALQRGLAASCQASQLPLALVAVAHMTLLLGRGYFFLCDAGSLFQAVPDGFVPLLYFAHPLLCLLLPPQLPSLGSFFYLCSCKFFMPTVLPLFLSRDSLGTWK